MATDTQEIDVNSFLPKRTAKKRAQPTEDEVLMTVVDESGIEGNAKSSSGGSKAKRVKKADSMKIAVPIRRYVNNR